MGKILAIICFIMGFSLTKYQGEKSHRDPASVHDVKYYKAQDIDDRLYHLYVYQMIELKGIERPFSSERTLAKKQLTNEIFNELIEHANPEQLRLKVLIFAKKSPLNSMAVSGLLKRFKYKQSFFEVSQNVIRKELRITENTQEFIVLEQNVEHLSHLIKIKASKSLNASSEQNSNVCNLKIKDQAICNL